MRNFGQKIQFNMAKDILIDVAEAVVICAALKEFITRLESDRNAGNSIEIDATIAFCRIVGQKYYQQSKTPVKKDLNGRFMPVTTSKN